MIFEVKISRAIAIEMMVLGVGRWFILDGGLVFTVEERDVMRGQARRFGKSAQKGGGPCGFEKWVQSGKAIEAQAGGEENCYYWKVVGFVVRYKFGFNNRG